MYLFNFYDLLIYYTITSITLGKEIMFETNKSNLTL